MLPVHGRRRKLLQTNTGLMVNANINSANPAGTAQTLRNALGTQTMYNALNSAGINLLGNNFQWLVNVSRNHLHLFIENEEMLVLLSFVAFLFLVFQYYIGTSKE